MFYAIEYLDVIYSKWQLKKAKTFPLGCLWKTCQIIGKKKSPFLVVEYYVPMAFFSVLIVDNENCDINKVWDIMVYKRK